MLKKRIITFLKIKLNFEKKLFHLNKTKKIFFYLTY